MKKNLLLLLLLVALFSGCKKGDSTGGDSATDKGTPPSVFNVNVTVRESDYAIVKWTRSVASNGGNVTYSVTLNGNKLTENLTDTTFKISNLTTSSTQGQIIAKDSKGATTTQDFYINPSTGYIYGNIDKQYYACYNLSGSLKWSKAIGYARSSVVVNDTVFVQTVAYQTTAITVYALNAQTGAIYWQNTATSFNSSELIYSGGVIYLINGPLITALNRLTGQKIIELNSSHNSDWKPRIGGGVLLLIDSTYPPATLRAIDLKTGIQRWAQVFNNQSLGGPIEYNGSVYILSCGANNSFLNSIDTKTGVIKWQLSCSQSTPVLGSRPMAMNGVIYLNLSGNPYNSLYAVTEKGLTRWVNTNVRDGAILGNSEGIYINGGKLTKLNVTTGKEIWNQTNLEVTTITSNSLFGHTSTTYGGDIPVGFTVVNTTTGAITASPANNIKLLDGSVIVIGGVSHYSADSGMFTAVD